MKKLFVWIPLLALFSLIAVLGLNLLSATDPSAVATPLAGLTTPPIDIPSFSPGGSGKNAPHITSNDFGGKPVLVNFFASWCGPCAEENGVLMDLAAKHEIPIIGIALKDSAAPLAAYLKKRGNPYDKIGMDENGHLATDWGVTGVPETFAVNAKGIIVKRNLGAMEAEDAEDLVKAAQTQ